MNKIFYFFILIILISGCSLNKNSKFWTTDIIKELENKKFEKIFEDKEALEKELNNTLKLNLNRKSVNNMLSSKLTNNDGISNFNGSLKKSIKI